MTGGRKRGEELEHETDELRKEKEGGGKRWEKGINDNKHEEKAEGRGRNETGDRE